MAEELDTSWFDLKNYEPLKTMSIDGWASVLESRAYLKENCDYYLAKQKDFDSDEQEDYEWELQVMANELKAGCFSVDLFADACISEETERILESHSFSTSSVDSLRNYQAWDMANDRWPNRELSAFQKIRDEWQKPCEDDEDGLLEVAHAPYDFHFKKYLNMSYIQSSAHVAINLDATDKQIKNDFSYWLTHFRKAVGYPEPLPMINESEGALYF